MDTWTALLQGFATAATPINLLWALLGCTVGTAVGVLPGIGPATAVAMLLPITLQVESTASMIFFAGIYYGAMYGGSTTSILLNTPGEAGSMVTAMEGNKMARNGRAGAALATAAIGSFVAGTIATVLVTFFAPLVARYAVKLGPPEYFMLMLFAFVAVSSVLGKSTLRGLTALFIGLAMGLVGIDQITAQARYTLGVAELTDGLEVVLIAVGLFAVAEALYAVLYEGRSEETSNRMSKVHMTAAEWRRSWPAWLRATFIGFPFGTIPAGGSEIPTFLSYATEKKLSKHKEEFGSVGAIEGVAGPEAANNAAITATLIPLLTLGIPHLQHHRDPARCVPELRHPARAAAVRYQRRAGVGTDRLAVHRQRDAADPQSSAGGLVGEAAAHPEGAAVRRHPDLRHRGCVRHAAIGVRPGAAVRDRPARRGDAALRLPYRTGGGGHDPRAAGRSAHAQCDVDRRRPLERVCRSTGVAGAAGGDRGGAGAAAGAAPTIALSA
jgi:TctA family transporter